MVLPQSLAAPASRHKAPGAHSAESAFDTYVDEDPTSTLPEDITTIVTTSCVCICCGHSVRQDSATSAGTVAAGLWSSISSVWGETPDPDPGTMALFVAEVGMIGVYKFQVDYALPVEQLLLRKLCRRTLMCAQGLQLRLLRKLRILNLRLSEKPR